MKVALDAMGGDHAPAAEVEGAALAVREYGVRTWGAYQHYGNPHFRLFEEVR